MKNKRGRPTKGLEANILARIMWDSIGECWGWAGSRNNWGYARIFNHRTKKTVAVHRIIWEMAHNHPIPAGYAVDHICHNYSRCKPGRCQHRSCINPFHLQLTTKGENVRRSLRYRRMYCEKGHRLTIGNIRIGKDGKHRCLDCQRKYSRDYNRERYRRLNKISPNQYRLNRLIEHES